VSDCCLMLNEPFSAITWQEEVTLDDGVHFTLDQHAYSDHDPSKMTTVTKNRNFLKWEKCYILS
jgi:hypothetical protein